ncbi:cupin domain-containing protein, partial [Bacillus pacificus]|uniref:cupin domain-containing protein n=1 Tax=Bacillus pacificus TaxID=2026187 RepID=UPI001E5B4BE7
LSPLFFPSLFSSPPSLPPFPVLSPALSFPPFSFLLEDTNTDDLIVRSHKRKKMIIDNLSYEMLSPDFTGNLATAIMTVPPNTASSENVLEHKGEELAFVLEGKITLHLNEEEYILETGDSVKIPAYLKHKWVNQFEKNAIVLFSVTPPIF